jgi:hypothetical protein
LGAGSLLAILFARAALSYKFAFQIDEQVRVVAYFVISIIHDTAPRTVKFISKFSTFDAGPSRNMRRISPRASSAPESSANSAP